MVRSFFLLYDDLLESLGMNAKLSAANYPSGLLSFADSRPVSSLLAMFISHRAFHHIHFLPRFHVRSLLAALAVYMEHNNIF